MWLTSRLAPDFKTIARFRKDNGKAIRSICRQFVVLCQRLDLFAEAIVASDGSKFKAENPRDRNRPGKPEVSSNASPSRCATSGACAFASNVSPSSNKHSPKSPAASSATGNFHVPCVSTSERDQAEITRSGAIARRNRAVPEFHFALRDDTMPASAPRVAHVKHSIYPT
jgi:hypothetical protein